MGDRMETVRKGKLKDDPTCDIFVSRASFGDRALHRTKSRVRSIRIGEDTQL